MSITTITASEALSILETLSPTFYREDTVLVHCHSRDEAWRVAAVAQQAIANGLVARALHSNHVGEHTVLIGFRKPRCPGQW